VNRDFEHLRADSVEVHEKHAGKWIAVVDAELIGIGDTAPAAANQASPLAREVLTSSRLPDRLLTFRAYSMTDFHRSHSSDRALFASRHSR
jgi:hypothetical protein